MTHPSYKVRLEPFKRLANAVDRFLLAFEDAKATPKDEKLLDRLTSAVLKLEKTRDSLK